MDRATAQKINNDPQIVRLRLQVEDLVNGMEHMSEEEYNIQSKHLDEALTKRFAELYAEYE